MTCCQKLADGRMQGLPFIRTLATGYYDGPTEGFTECNICKRVFSFRMLDWDNAQNVRIMAFAPLQTPLAEIMSRLSLVSQENVQVILVPALAQPEDTFVQHLLQQPPTHVTALAGWPGQALVWRAVNSLGDNQTGDWFSWLGVLREATEG